MQIGNALEIEHNIHFYREVNTGLKVLCLF